MKKSLKPLLIGMFLALVVLIGCEEATADDCRDDSRCLEVPSKGSGNFVTKNALDPCPCAD